uniref:Uncharacterized protein n=1 Tax=Anopheles maculatus TaxID=74869 RepID=A0A182S941_9DIPT
MKVGSVMYWAAFSATCLKMPSNVSRAHCNVCSIAFGKFFSVQIGIDFSGGSCEELYDSWLAVVHTTAIHVDTCVNVVERICNAIQPVKERIIVEALRFRPDTVLVRCHLDVPIHALHCLSSNTRLRLLYIVRAEKELTIKIALLDQVHIGHNDLAITLGRYPDHGKVFQQLTTDSTSTDDEVLQLSQHILELAAKYGNLSIVPRTGRCALFFRQIGLLQALDRIVAQVLVDGREFARASLHHFLRSNATNCTIHRT